MENRNRIKYLRDKNGAPIACIAYLVTEQNNKPVVNFSLSIANQSLYDQIDVSKKNLFDYIKNVFCFLTGKSKTVKNTFTKKSKKDFFIKKEGSRIAKERLIRNPNCISVTDALNPMMDILTYLENEHRILLDTKSTKIISSRIRSAAHRAKQNMLRFPARNTKEMQA